LESTQILAQKKIPTAERKKMISETKLQKLYEQYFEFTDHMVSQYDPSAVAAIMLTQALSIYRTTMTEDDYNQMVDSISDKRDKVQIFQNSNLQ
jgi:hypothetical protein